MPARVLHTYSIHILTLSSKFTKQLINKINFITVLNEIISILISKELISDLMTQMPQPVYSQDRIKQTIGDIAQSSIMRLDAISMDKLWDLVTMVYKWQVTLGADVLKITRRHVTELEDYISNGEVLLQLRRVQNIVDNFGVLLNRSELSRLKDEILDWLGESASNNVKVSLLLKMGLQNVDGTFVAASEALYRSSRQYEMILSNLGQNIYNLTEIASSVTRSDKVNKWRDDNGNSGAQNLRSVKGKYGRNGGHEEVNLLVNQLMGGEGGAGGRGIQQQQQPRTSSTKYGESLPKRNVLKLNIGNSSSNSVRGQFKNVDDEQTAHEVVTKLQLERIRSTIDLMMADMNLNDMEDDNVAGVKSATDLKEDLLVLIADDGDDDV